jgi:hypothetical protein
MGFILKAHQVECVSSVPTIETHKEQVKKARKQALEVMKWAQELLGHKTNQKLYQKG